MSGLRLRGLETELSELGGGDGVWAINWRRVWVFAED